MFALLYHFVRLVLGKSAKPAAMVAVAGILALSLTITTTQKAEANPLVALPVVAAAESIVGGASLPFVAPSMLTMALATNPVGWTIAGVGALALIGVGLYASRDYWLPWVQDPAGSWGKATGANPSSTPAAGAKIWPGLVMSGTQQINTTVTQVNGNYSGGSASSSSVIGYSLHLWCKKPSTGAIIERSAAVTTGFGQAAYVVGPKYFQVGCNNGGGTAEEIIVGGMVGAFGADPLLGTTGTTGITSYNGPENIYRWGTAVPVGTPAFNPADGAVKYKSTSECVDAGGNKTTVTAESVGSDGAVKFASCEAAGKGHGTGVQSITGTAPGTTTETPLWTSAPQADPNKPLCAPTRPGTGCAMTITIDSKPCTIGSWDCEHWTDIYKDPNTKARVGCTYGPYTMAVDDCKVMEPAYRPGGAPGTQENIDGNPDTTNNTQPSGSQYTPPGTTTVPGGAATGAPSGSSPDEQQCFPQGWAMLNPVEWVERPVGCALKSAFVPSDSVVQTQSSRIQDKIKNVGFARVTTAWQDTFNAVGGASGSGGGCSGPNVRFSMEGVTQDIQPFNACSQPMAGAASVSYALSSIVLALGGGLGVLRAIASAFGFNFTLGKGSGA